MIDPWYLEHLVCPIDYENLLHNGNYLTCNSGHKYPIVNEVPIMLISGASETFDVMMATLKTAQEIIKNKKSNDLSSGLFLDTLGISEEE